MITVKQIAEVSRHMPILEALRYQVLKLPQYRDAHVVMRDDESGEMWGMHVSGTMELVFKWDTIDEEYSLDAGPGSLIYEAIRSIPDQPVFYTTVDFMMSALQDIRENLEDCHHTQIELADCGDGLVVSYDNEGNCTELFAWSSLVHDPHEEGTFASAYYRYMQHTPPPKHKRIRSRFAPFN